MADVKISGLPAAGAITGSELVPIVQGGVTSQSTVNGIKPSLSMIVNELRYFNRIRRTTSDGIWRQPCNRLRTSYGM